MKSTEEIPRKIVTKTCPYHSAEGMLLSRSDRNGDMSVIIHNLHAYIDVSLESKCSVLTYDMATSILMMGQFKIQIGRRDNIRGKESCGRTALALPCMNFGKMTPYFTC